MTSQSIKEKAVTNFIWRFAERTGAQLVAFVVSIILARMLDPNLYGTVALIMVITSILQVFVDSGFGNALIQKKDADNLDFSTVFYTNVIFCLFLYLLLFLLSPRIASFYNDIQLTPYIRVLGITILASGLKNVQQAYVSRHMMFRKFFFSTLIGTIIAAISGIMLAYKGYGVWALVVQQVANVSIDTLVLWITVRWRPERIYSFERIKILFSFGWKLLISALLDTVYNNIRQLVIGKVYSASDLGFYNRGRQFPNVIVENINSSIDSVLLPAMSCEQDNKQRVRDMTRRSIQISIYIMAPLMMGLAFSATTIVKLVLTEKWLPCVSFLRIFCITFMFYPIHTANLNAIKAMGRSDLFLWLEILKKGVGMLLLLSTMWFGVKAIAYGMLISSLTGQIINSWPNKKLLGYSYIEQLKDIMPEILLAVIMGCCVYPIGKLALPLIIVFILQIFAGAVIYILGSALFKIDSFRYMLDLLESFLKRKKDRSGT